jgi:ribosomal-protein-alanine N-acetyltransferase
VPLRAPRPLEARDLDAVAALERAIFGDPWSRRSFEEMLALGHVRGFVLEGRGGRVAGYAVGSVAGDEGEILNLAVAPRRRRRGLGKLLLGACLAWMRTEGVATVHLEVRRSNDAAIAMYVAAGFEPVGVRPKYYRKPTEDAVTMTLAALPARALE